MNSATTALIAIITIFHTIRVVVRTESVVSYNIIRLCFFFAYIALQSRFPEPNDYTCICISMYIFTSTYILRVILK